MVETMNTPAKQNTFAKSVAGFFIGLLFAAVNFSSVAATFPGNTDLSVPDPSGALSWNSGNAALSVQCWFKISIPSGTNLTQNMTILANGNSGSESQFAYLVRFNISNGNVEFVSQGSSGDYTNTLIQLPYLERWYHLAIVQQGATFTGYVDGRQVFSSSGNVGNTANTSGISIGGWGSGQYLFGEVQEVSIYQNALSQDFIVQYMFDQQPTNDSSLGLVGYFPVGYAINPANELANFAPAPVPNGTASASKQGSGTVTFEATDESGEQSAFDAQRNGGRDALAPLSGAYSWQQTAFARPTPGVAMDFKFGYSSANSFGGFQLGGNNPYSSGSMGSGWRQTFETRVLPAQTFSPLGDADTVGLMRWDGSLETWDLNYDSGEYETRNSEYNGELVITTTNCQWTTPQRLVYVFRRPDSGANFVMRGRLTAIHDFNGNSVQILWNQTSGVITQVVDSANGIYNFKYQGNLLTNVTFGSWLVNFSYDATNRLVSKSVTNTAGLYGNVASTWQFQYGTNGLLARIVDPRGNTNVFVQYDQYGRQTNQVDALGRTTATRYEIPGERQITRVDPATNSWVETYDRKGHTLSQTDPLNQTTSYTYDDSGNRTSATEPLGWTTLFGYDGRANVIARTNALGEITTWIFDSFFNKAVQQITPQPPDASGSTAWTNFYAYDAGGNLTNHSDALGALVSYTYSTNGLVLASKDANGHTTGFAYDTNGFLVSRTDPATNTTTYLVNELGWKLHETDALGNPTSYTYDQNGNVTRIQDALGRVYNRVYDANGNLLSSTDGKNQLTAYAYDLVNQKTNMIDRTGTNQWKYFYTSRGKLDHVTDALGFSVTNIYDAANRLVQITDPLGHSITNQYDANGNIISFFDKTGQRWTKTYDRLNRVVAESDPLGDTKNTAYDMAGRIQQITSPNGYPSLNTYDGRGRLTKWVDPQNFSWLYAYDGVANITNITDALGGHYIMAYGSRNERTLEKNQDRFVWQYAYDNLLRLTNQVDPNGVTRIPTYDNAGRVLFVDFSTGRHDSFSYDSNDNPQTVSRRVSGVTTATQFIYDSLDRVIEQDDALGKTVLYGYDSLRRVTSITYPGGKTLSNTFDALGRLTAQSDWAGRQMTYIYDLADRLISRTYPNGIVQTNTFDFAGRISGLNYSPATGNSNSINIALAYAYDHNGNKTGSSESGTFNWPQPSLTDDQSSFTPAGRLITRQIQNNSAASNQLSSFAYHYDASGNMTNAVGNGQSWTLAYDEDNRTTSIDWEAGITSKIITNRYDALGRRISKTVDGVTAGYVLSLVGGMEKILCDLDGGGNVTAWYVYGPDLCYRVDSTNGLLCYHADAQANVIALTDGNTNFVAQYAYAPYGRSLGSTNYQSQISNPYLFVGSQGVMEESGIPNLYFMRARYYSADAGIFLSTDTAKHIGQTWQPLAYVYASGNPLSKNDPNGQFAVEILTSLIAESISIDYDIVVRGKNVTWSELGARYVKAAAVGATGGAIAEYGGTLFAGTLGKVAAYATKGIVSFGGNALVSAAKGDFNLDAVASETFVDNAVGTIGFFGNGYAAKSLTDFGNTLFGFGKDVTGDFIASSVNNAVANRSAASMVNRTITAASVAPIVNSRSTTPAGYASSGGGGTISNNGGGSTTYTVRPGDTLGNIGSQFGSTATAIGSANGIQNLNLIHPGQVLTIPHR